MSEIAPRKVRGALVSGYQFCITIGILIANGAVYGTKERKDTGSYRIPIAIQFAWALVLGTGLVFLPESPRYFVKKGRIEEAAKALASVRGQPVHRRLDQLLLRLALRRQQQPSTIDSWNHDANDAAIDR
jgi:MFS family permease